MAVDVTAAVLGIVIGLGVAIAVLLVVLAVYCKARRDVELVVGRRQSQVRRRTKFTSTELRDADNNNRRRVVYAPNDEIRVYDDDNRPPQMYGIAYRPRMYFPDVPAEVARPQLVDGFPDGPVDYGFVSRPTADIAYQHQQNPRQFVEVYRDNAAYRDDVEPQAAQPTQQQVDQTEHRWTDDRRDRETEEQSAEDSDDSDESDEQETTRRPVARPMNIDRRHHIMTPFAFNMFQPPQTAIVALPTMLPAAPTALQAAPVPAPAVPVQQPPPPPAATVQPTPPAVAVPVQQPSTSDQSAEIRREPEFTWTATSSGSAVVSNFVPGSGYVAAGAGARPDSGGHAMFGRTDDDRGFSWQQQLQQPREYEEQERSAIKGDGGGGGGRRINGSNQAGASSESYVARAVVDGDVRQRSAAVVAGVHGQQRTSEEQERSATVDLISTSNNGPPGAAFSASAYSPGFQ